MLIEWIKKTCFNAVSYYHLLKKDDDLGITHLAQFKRMCNSHFRALYHKPTQEIKHFAEQLVIEAQHIPVTADNVNEIRNHLCKIANINGRYQTYLSQALHQSDIDLDLRKKLIISVILQFPLWS